jgi:hypothetical protein
MRNPARRARDRVQHCEHLGPKNPQMEFRAMSAVLIGDYLPVTEIAKECRKHPRTKPPGRRIWRLPERAFSDVRKDRDRRFRTANGKI